MNAGTKLAALNKFRSTASVLMRPSNTKILVVYPENGSWYKQVSKRLQSVSEVLCNCPHLTQHVRYGNIRSYGYGGKTDIF